MRFITDLHIHSKYSRACSKNISIENLEKYARIKGIDVLGTGDFQHPLWGKELKDKLTPAGGGIMKTESGFPFILTTEVSNMFSQGGKGRRVHSLILAPDMETVNQITDVLGSKGRLDYDGRPIFGFSCIELVEMMQEINKTIEVIPAHAWTPWFGVLGSKSGFDSLEECFRDQRKHVHAIETGLSSDPVMNWRISGLDNTQLVSFSDAHSFWPHRLGREATVFQMDELNYADILNAIRTGHGLEETIEVDPAYGKYHWDGHRNCNVVMSPERSIKNNGICHACKKQLTIGVEHRVVDLADMPEGRKPDTRKPFRHLIPLSEIIAAIMGSQPFSKKVQETYYKFVGLFGNEFNILLNREGKELEDVDKKIAQSIINVREDKVTINPPGYDGVYGELSITKQKRKLEPLQDGPKQKALSEF